ncbi:Lipase [Gossypium australe]|uniref:Lipase n=1 Tax=Gossypium australe TaxID=47621 RepID=A0A5B6VNZ5_9ROSI|nr:Lipase [Gossypium australe]
MIAAISPPPPTATLGPGRIRVPNSNRHSIRFSNLGFLLWKPKLNWISYERVRQMQMAWVRSMAGGCFKSKEPLPELRIKVEEDSGGQDFFDPDAMASKVSPEHLVIMVNGLIGSLKIVLDASAYVEVLVLHPFHEVHGSKDFLARAADWRFAAEKFVAKLPDKVIVHRSECNYSKLTFDGVDMMGERLAQEVLDVVKRRPEVRKISFVAHSLGGLVARYAIGRLYENSTKLGQSRPFVSTLTGEHTNSSMQDLEQHSEDRIAGLEPMNFITFATPHLGSRGHKQLPLLCGLPFLEKRASQTAHFVVGRSGKHLFLTDNDEGKPPLLLRMVDDGDDLKFISALHAFKRRVAYANANYDHMVGWRTSSIRRQNELPKSNLLVLDEKYPHVVYIERETTNKIQNKASSIARSQTSTSDVEGFIFGRLGGVRGRGIMGNSLILEN